MAIRINLLAEAQALEEMRRRDPVKRVILVGVVLVLGVMGYSSSLQVKSIMVKGELARVEGQLGRHQKEYQVVLDHQRHLAEVNRKMEALHSVATNRLLHGSVLNALQQTTVPEVQLVRFRADQTYLLAEEIKTKTNGNRVIPGKPATVTERVVVLLEARDTSPTPGDAINQFKDKIAQAPQFSLDGTSGGEVRLASLSPPTGGTKPFVLFSLECRFPEKTR